MTIKIPGGLSATKFLREYWQKKPLLIRNAFPKFQGLLNKEELIFLSGTEEAPSRLISYHQGKWILLHGPFKKHNFSKPKGNWALLVQDVHHFLPEAQALIKNFNFIPYARLDDLMVSFAPNGGGVGPHVDLYDVFLLQGCGKRLWQISSQKNHRLVEDSPLKILKNFQPEQEWLLEPGDMLYLPPNYAHNGIAVGDCMTYSIGFRAPSYQTLLGEFLGYLQENLVIEGRYADPKLKLAKHPARISNEMIVEITKALEQIDFGKIEIEDFLGKFLTEPKSHVFFDPPESPMSKNNFLKRIKQQGISLDLKTLMLFTDTQLFINGETYSLHSSAGSILKNLADERRTLVPDKIDKQTSELLYNWYLNGYLI
jgi:50S ribosomal protein L16 3-hydroxylase